MNGKRNICFFFILTMLLTKAAAGQSQAIVQDNYTKFFSYTTNQGLSCSDILDVLQDKYGFIWIATKNGLNKFNGQKFTNHFFSPNDVHSISDNLVTSLAEDIYGTVWIGTDNGLCKYNRNQNHFERITSEDGSILKLSDNNIRALYADKNGNLWIETLHGGLNCLHISTNTLINYPHESLSFEGDYFYHFIFEDSKHRIWIGGRNFYPRFLNSEKKSYEPGDSFNGNDGSCIFEDKNKIIWTSGNYGFNYYNENSKKLDDSAKYQLPFRIHSVLNDKNGILWFGGDGEKIFSFDQNDEKWTSFAHDNTNPFSIVSTKINKIYKDRQGNIWFATSKGLSVIPFEINKFRHFRYLSGNQQSIHSNNITALLQDRRGTLWVGSEDNGIDTARLENEQFANIKYQILNKEIDKETFQKEKDVLKKYAAAKIISAGKQRYENSCFNDFEIYRRSNFKSNIESENKVSCLYEDKTGTIFIGLWNGVGFNTFKYGEGFKRDFLFAERGSSVFKNEITGANWYNGFLEDKNGRFWIATWEGIGLNLYDREKKEFEGLNFSGDNYSLNKAIYSILGCRDSLLWFNNFSLTFSCLNLKTGDYQAFISDRMINNPNFKSEQKYIPYSGYTLANIPKEDFPVLMIRDERQDLWVIFSSNSVAKYDAQKRRFKNYFLNNKKEQVTQAAYSPEEKKIYMSTVSGKIFSVSLTTFEIEHLAFVKTDLANIKDFIWFDDKLWIAQKDRLFTPGPKNEQVEYTEELLNVCSNPLNISKVSVCGRNIFIGSNNEIIVFNKEKRYFENLSKTAGFYPPVSHFTHFCADDNILWAGSSKGLFKIDVGKGSVVEFMHDDYNQKSLPDNEITALCLLKNDLFVATRKGLCSINTENNEITLLNQTLSVSLSTRLLTRLMEDNDGFIWIGTTEKGVNRMDTKTFRFDHFYEIPADTTSLLGDNVESIFQDSDKNVWIGTNKALNRYNALKKNFTRITLLGDLNPGPIKAIKEDAYKNLWISTTNGLIRFNWITGDIIQLTKHNGIQDNTFSNAACRLHDGRLAFGGENGITVFDPENINPEAWFPQIMLEHVKVDDSVAYTDFSERATMLLNYSKNNISFSLGTSEYFAPELIFFKYRLKNLETNWNTATVQNNQIKYNNLRPGKYELEISTCNVYGKWAPDLRTIFIQIQNPWWTTWWFISLALVFWVGFFVAIIRIREANLKKAKRELEKRVSERTAELAESVERLQKSETDLAETIAEKDKFFSLVAHDLKNPVLALRNISDKLVSEFERLTLKQQTELLSSMNRQIHVTYSFLDNLLLWALTQKNAIPFHPQSLKLSESVNEVVALLSENARAKKIELCQDIPDMIHVFADKNMVFTILNNLLNNAIKFSYPESEVFAMATEEGSYIKISVRDNGTGIPEEKIAKLFSITSKFRAVGTAKETGTGTGLLLCREFVEKNGGKIGVESFENKGSVFYFTLPKASSE